MRRIPVVFFEAKLSETKGAAREIGRKGGFGDFPYRNETVPRVTSGKSCTPAL
jgi:hypothetical protein